MTALTPADLLLSITFGLGLLMGLSMAFSNYCTMGAVSDVVNMGSWIRLRAWMTAIAVASLGVAGLGYAGMVDVTAARVPYTGAILAWPRYVLGGVIFGVGMTLAAGCTSKNLIRLGGGSIKALVTLLFAASTAYLMMRTTFYGDTFHKALSPLFIGLADYGIDDQRVGTLLAASQVGTIDGWNQGVGVALGVGLLGVVFAAGEYRQKVSNWIGGITVGVAVAGAWYLTSSTLGTAWIDEAEFMHIIPQGVGVQSFTFVSPLGETVHVIADSDEPKLLSFGIAGALGVLVGSFLYHLMRMRLHLEWFSSWHDFLRHTIGGLMMGLGGVLALGCTVGQGVTGVSTLATGSLLATASIVLGATVTMKVEYYRLVYEEQASFGGALLSALADLHLVPQSARRLDRV